MKRIIASILIVALVLSFAIFALSGCRRKGVAPDFVMPEGGLTTEPITITFYHSMGGLQRSLSQHHR